MRRYAMQDRIATCGMRFVLHDRLHILLVTDMHDAARCQAFFPQDVEEDFDWWDRE
jgi:hypothetical protein